MEIAAITGIIILIVAVHAYVISKIEIPSYPKEAKAPPRKPRIIRRTTDEEIEIEKKKLLKQFGWEGTHDRKE